MDERFDLPTLHLYLDGSVEPKTFANTVVCDMTIGRRSLFMSTSTVLRVQRCIASLASIITIAR